MEASPSPTVSKTGLLNTEKAKLEVAGAAPIHYTVEGERKDGVDGASGGGIVMASLTTSPLPNITTPQLLVQVLLSLFFFAMFIL